MGRESLYEIACEMLKTTNVYSKSVESMEFTSSHTEYNQEKISLLGLVDLELAQLSRRYSGRSAENLQHCYMAIADSLEEYLQRYHASFSFKQRTKAKFEEWLRRIRKAYNLDDQAIPESLDTSKDVPDLGVAMIKMLHAREGVTKEDFAKELPIQKRAVQKNLRRLSPSIYEGDSATEEPYLPFCLGGQPIKATIEVIRPKDVKDQKRYYRTKNTVHPIVLQENIMQVGALMKALCNQYNMYNDWTCVSIGIDIWLQLSHYAQMKLKTFYSHNDPDLSDFIEMIDNDFPDDHASTYRTERDMMMQYEYSVDNALEFLEKAPGRKAIVTLKNGESFEVKELYWTDNEGGVSRYKVIKSSGGVAVIVKDQIKDITII